MAVLKYKEFVNENLNEAKFSEDDRVRTKGGIDFGDEMFTVIHQKGNKVTVEDDEDEIQIFKASELELVESVNEGSTFDINGTFKSILVDYGDSILIARLDSNEIPSYQSRYLGHIKELTSGTKVTEYIYGENRGYDEVVKETVNKLKSKGSVITKKDGYVVTVSYNSKKIYSNAYLVNVDVSSTQDTSQISQMDVEELERLLTPFNDIFGKSYWVKVNSTLVRFGKTHTSRKKKDKILEEIKKMN